MHDPYHKGNVLCAVVHPCYDAGKNSWWDGTQYLAHQILGKSETKSNHHGKGTPVWKNQSITCKVYRELHKTKLIPFLEKWPTGDRQR